MNFKVFKIGIFALSCLLPISACGGSQNEPEPPFEPEIVDETVTHEFSTAWSSDAKYHWHVALDDPNVTSDKEEHDFSSWEEVNAASEFAPGNKKRECSVCHYIEYDTIPMLEHEHTYASTFSYDENSHWKAATCGHDLKIESASHNFVPSVISNATFESPEIIRYSCTECDYFYDEGYDVLSHEYNDTYSYNEYTHWRSCTDEGYENLKIDNYAHVYDEWKIDSQTDELIVKSRKCLVCEYIEVHSETLVHTHTYADTYSFDDDYHWIAATCGHDVKINYFKHHLHKTVITEPTYENYGVMKYECETCDYTYKEAILPLTHLYSERWTFDEEYHYHKCIDVGYEELYSDKDTHQFTDWFIDIKPSCETNGHKYAFCDVCGYYIEESIAPTGHSFNLNSWSYNNEQHYHSATCGHDVTIDNENHDYDITVRTEPTYDRFGVRRYSCKTCGYYFDESIPKLVHQYSELWSSDETYHFHSCIDDGYEHLYIDRASHTYGDWTEVEKTTYEDGYRYRYCSVCNYRQEEITDICDAHQSEKYLTFGIYSDGSSGDYAYVLDANEQLIKTDGVTEIIVPKTHVFENSGELPVRMIGDNAFADCNTLTNVIFPDTNFARVGDYAFKNCSKLTSLNIPSTVTYVGVAAFLGCDSLSSLIIPFVGASTLNDGNRDYMQSLFTSSLRTSITQDCLPESLKEITISNQTTIATYAFWLCRNITNIHYVKEITNRTIAPYTFSGCVSLVSVPSFPNVYYVEEYAFRSCEALTSVDIPGLNYVGEYAFSNCKALTNVNIEGLIGISKRAFNACYCLTNLTFGVGLKSIDQEAFYGCNGVTSITFKSPVVNGIGQKAFYSVNPTYMRFEANPGGGQDSYLNCFNSVTKLTTLYIKSWSDSIRYLFATQAGKTPSLPSSINKIVVTGTNVTDTLGFSSSFSIDTLEFGDEVETITGDVFLSTMAVNITTLKIGKNVREIDTRYLSMNGNSRTYGMNIIVDPENQYFTVEGGILYNKEKTKILATLNYDVCHQDTFYIDENVQEIDEYALSGSRIISANAMYMKRFEVHPNNQYFATDGDALYTKDMKELIRVQAMYEGEFVVPSTVERIRSFAFKECYYITNIVMSDSLTSIGDCAFYSMTRLETLSIPSGVISVGGNVFYGNTNLTQVSLPDTLTYIDQYFFINLNSSTSVSYSGTTAQLLALFESSGITKDYCSFTITCSNGEVTL